ncbi:tyrosine-protein kinase JAK2 [Trichomycterus rosablanca]|uniref:tyrosine-protein kinase JAK2 n=1 Tax=Trichomycterus rosablanca TaxID=2290929 RepID=UPI002F3611B9
MDVSEEDMMPLINDRSASHKSSCDSFVLLHLYHSVSSQTEGTVSIPAGHVTAESVCTLAAKSCGVLPVFHNLFALASEDLTFWYPPTHVFKSDKNTTVHYRVRYFFSGWFGQGSRATYRYSLSSGRICAVLDYSVIDYLFAQSRSDFVSSRGGVCPPLNAIQECLGLAVLDLWRQAKEGNRSLKEVCKSTSYKSCLPNSHREEIQRMSRLARYQIRKTLKRFLKKLGRCAAGERSLKLKYLMELSAMEPEYGTETFNTRRCVVRVSGEGGIQTYSDDGQEWQTFCDFPQITDINMKRLCPERLPAEGRVVTLTRQDDRCLEVEFETLTDSLSFVSLVDNYFRLTTDSSHYFCSEVAPPTLLQDIESHCHGPVTSEFAVHKLKKGGAKNGTYLLRRSPRDYDKYFLMVCLQTPLGWEYKDCLIEKNEKFHLAGIHTSFSSLKDLTSFYQHHMLLLADVPVTLRTCCPPRAKELSNLIIVRNSSVCQTPSSPPQHRHRSSHIQFHMIKHEDLVWKESLGQGSFTHIYRGLKTDQREGETYTTEVLLKVLDVEHKNSWESFFEAASFMSQISHKHLLLVYGVTVHKSKNIMVQEFVKYGALDLYLKRSSVSLSWKLDVAKQLACTLNFLEEKNIVHGNICAKNLLLAREGDPTSKNSPFIKLSDPGISVAMLGKEVVLDRIPWVAPEVLENLELGQQSDKWSFGTTLWEIFNGGEVPLQRLDPKQKQSFYDQRSHLPCLEWTELADLISQCMQYQPELRPSSRTVIRHLNSLITPDYEILHAAASMPERDGFWRALTNQQTQPQQQVYEERHLKFISALGKGNFGSVDLCRYDPLGDNTGELVAVKQLQSSKQGNLVEFQREIQTISSLHCDYIVKYRGICYSAGRLSMRLVMEFLPFGNLISYIEKNKKLINNRRLLLFSSQICKGMEYLQNLRYVHRDLAARNILVSSDMLVKIADFGLTKIIPVEKEYYRVTQSGESPIFWYSPESLSEYKFSHKSDVWSFGVLLHEMFSFCELSRNPKRLLLQKIGGDLQGAMMAVHLFNILKENWRLPVPPMCPPKVCSMMMECWAFGSEDRPSFSQLQDLIESSLQDEREGAKG